MQLLNDNLMLWSSQWAHKFSAPPIGLVSRPLSVQSRDSVTVPWWVAHHVVIGQFAWQFRVELRFRLVRVPRNGSPAQPFGIQVGFPWFAVTLEDGLYNLQLNCEMVLDPTQWDPKTVVDLIRVWHHQTCKSSLLTHKIGGPTWDIKISCFQVERELFSYTPDLPGKSRRSTEAASADSPSSAALNETRMPLEWWEKLHEAKKRWKSIEPKDLCFAGFFSIAEAGQIAPRDKSYGNVWKKCRRAFLIAPEFSHMHMVLSNRRPGMQPREL